MDDSQPELEQLKQVAQAYAATGNREGTLELLQQLLTPAVCRRLGLYPIPNTFLLSVVIPIYNEVDTVRTVVDRVQQVPVPLEIILVDDGSTDGTREILERFHGQPRTTVLHHATNRGKGAAIRTGLSRANGEAVIIQDADLELSLIHI